MGKICCKNHRTTSVLLNKECIYNAFICIICLLRFRNSLVKPSLSCLLLLGSCRLLYVVVLGNEEDDLDDD